MYGMTAAAQAALRWAADNVRINSWWRWNAPDGEPDVIFAVLEYETLADPEGGCIFEIGRLRVWDRDAFRAPRSGVPPWLEGTYPWLTALRLQKLVAAGAIQKFNAS